MKTIWKYSIPIEDDIEIEMPHGAEILCVQMQGGEPRLWVLIDPEGLMTTRRFRLAGTGHPIEEIGLKYIGSFQMLNGRLVYHLFEKINL